MTFIQDNLNHYTVSQLCSALKFPRSTYYKALVRVPSNRQEEYEKFSHEVKQVDDDSKQRYGAVKICRTLNGNGIPCSVKRVQRHMVKQGLRSVVVKKYNRHANCGAVPDDKANILGRDFEAETIHQEWCTDITCISLSTFCVQSIDIGPIPLGTFRRTFSRLGLHTAQPSCHS